jgi:hypothetical protein
MFRRVAVTLLVVLPFALVGCAPTQSEMEQEIKKGIQNKFNKNVTSISLQKIDANNWKGTATTDDGSGYDLTVKVNGRSYEWKAQADLAGIEKMFREEIKKQSPTLIITSITGTKDANGDYTGVATLSNGQRLRLKGNWLGETLNMTWAPE